MRVIVEETERNGDSGYRDTCVETVQIVLPSLSCWSSINRRLCAATKATPKLKMCDRKLRAAGT